MGAHVNAELTIHGHHGVGSPRNMYGLNYTVRNFRFLRFVFRKVMVARSFVSLFVGLWFSALYLRDLYGDRMVRAKVDTKLPLSSDDTDDVSDETHRHTPNSVHL